MREAEREFLLRTVYSASISLVFSTIGCLLLGPIGVLGVFAQVALFQRRLFRDLDLFLLTERS
jgi:hypothetical protein